MKIPISILLLFKKTWEKKNQEGGGEDGFGLFLGLEVIFSLYCLNHEPWLADRRERRSNTQFDFSMRIGWFVYICSISWS